MHRDYLAAQGYLELGMYQEAWDSLELIPAEKRHVPQVLMVRLEIYRALKKYDGMATVAAHLIKVFPEDLNHWLNLSFAQRRYLGLEVAEETLLEAQKRFPDDASIYFNLACYICQQGRLKEAKEKLGRAIELDPQFQAVALADEDLKPIW